MIAFVLDEHLGLVLQAAEGDGVDDAIAVALEFAALGRWRLGMPAAAGGLGEAGIRRKRHGGGPY